MENHSESDVPPSQDRKPAQLGTDPTIDSVYRYMMYGLSIPERTLRSTAAMVGGVLHESASLLVPQAFKDSTTYNTFVQQMIDLLANDVGGVKSNTDPRDSRAGESTAANDPNRSEGNGAAPVEADVENYVAKKTVSTFVDLAGMATMHASPMTILAIVSDVAYGSKVFLHEVADELKKEGVIAENSTISNAADLLDAVGAASADTVGVFDMPPISVEGLQDAIERTREGIAKIDPADLIPQSEIQRLWDDMHEMAAREDVSMFEVSSVMTMYTLGKVGTAGKGALTTIRVTGSLVDRHFLEHYRDGLEEIKQRGIYVMLADSSKPYLDAVWTNFSGDKSTITEDAVSGRLAGRVWSGFSDWLGGEKRED